MAFERINIPKTLLAQHKWHKRTCELLALSVCIKCHYGDSLIKDVSIRKIQSIAHCGYSKAKTLLQMAKQNTEWFYYNPYTNNLLAKNFKKKFKVVSTDKHGRTCYSIYTIQIERKDYNIRELVSEFRNKLFLNAINAIEIREDKSKSKKKNLSCLPRISPLTNRKIQNICGLHNTKATYRMKKKLINSGIISYQSPRLVYATDCLSNEAIKSLNLSDKYMVISDGNGLGYILTHSKYKIEKTADKSSFKNIIFNHSRRLTFNASKKRLDEIEAYFERMEH